MVSRKQVIRCTGLCGVRLVMPHFCPGCYAPLCVYCHCRRCGRQGR
jgi:hypothetical protein